MTFPILGWPNNSTATSGWGFIPPDSELNTGFYALRDGIPHGGIDLQAPNGTWLRAVKSGVVTEIVPGYIISIYVENIDTSFGYLHISQINVSVGQVVIEGDFIGKVGENHLHFAMWTGNRTLPTEFSEVLDPYDFLVSQLVSTGGTGWYWELVDTKEGYYEEDVFGLQYYSPHLSGVDDYLWTRDSSRYAYEMKISDTALTTVTSGGYHHALYTNRTGISYIPNSTLGDISGTPYFTHPGGTMTLNVTPWAAYGTKGRGYMIIELEEGSDYPYLIFAFVRQGNLSEGSSGTLAWKIDSLINGTIDLSWGVTVHASYVDSNFLDNIYEDIYPGLYDAPGNFGGDWNNVYFGYPGGDMPPYFIFKNWSDDYYTVDDYTMEREYFVVLDARTMTVQTWDNPAIYGLMNPLPPFVDYPGDLLYDAPSSYRWFGTREGDIEEYFATAYGSIRKLNHTTNDWEFLYAPEDRDWENCWVWNNVWNLETTTSPVFYKDSSQLFFSNGSWFMVSFCTIGYTYTLALCKLHVSVPPPRTSTGTVVTSGFKM